MTRVRPLLAALVPLLPLLAGCAAEPSGPLALDLAADLPAAEVRKEVGGIDFGTAGARAYLVDGWYGNERAEWGGGTFVWSRGASSVLEVDVMIPRDLHAVLRCMPFALPGAPPQAVAVEVNGRRLTEIALAPGFADYTITLPGDSLVPGRNRLTFHYRWTAPANRAGGRRLAVAWDSLLFRPAPQAAAEEPQAEGDGDERALFVPFGVEVDYFCDLVGEATFSHGGLAGPRTLRRPAGPGGAAGRARRSAPSSWGRTTTRSRCRSPAPAAGSSASPCAPCRSIRRPAAAASCSKIRWCAAGGPSTCPAGPAPPPLAGSPPSQSPRPPIILFVAGNLRADRVGVYGSRRGLTPQIDAFARDAWIFEDAVAQSSATRPALVSLLTGLGPLDHGVQTARQDLPAEAVTLAEVLRDAGYLTAGLSASTEEAASGLDQGFAPFVTVDDPAAAVDRAVLWIGAYGQRGPFFLYLRAAPVDPSRRSGRRSPPPAERGVAAASARMDADVAAADATFGQLLGVLRSTGLYDKAMIVLTADHGEALGEHGRLGHGGDLHAEVLDIPLLVKLPGVGGGRRIRLPAQQIDLVPTLLGRLGLALPDGRALAGLDLARLAAPGAPAGLALRPRFSSVAIGRHGVMSVIQNGWKRIEPLSRRFGSEPQLFHRARDRAETRDLLALLPVRAGYLASLVRAEIQRTRQPLDAEERNRRLRRRLEEALGEVK